MKMILFKVAAAAAGITLALCLAAACAFWYVSRPKPPKPWNEKALVATEPPTFGPSTSEGYKFYFAYTAKNNTDDDYSINEPGELRIEARLSDGSLSNPLDANHIFVRTPVFIPAHQLGSVTLRFKLLELPAQQRGETDEAYHERLRLLLNDQLSSVKQFVLFDEAHRYQITLPPWTATKPPEPEGKKSKP
jgi:hypothetical protein